MTTAGQSARLRVRESTVADYDGVLALQRRHSLSWPVERQEYVEFWNTNPFRPPPARTPPTAATTGWVMDTADGRIVGYFGNIFLGFEYNGHALLAASPNGIAVDQEYRAGSIAFFGKYFTQAVDLLVMNTSNEVARRVYLGCGARDIPHPSYQQALFWVTACRGVAGSTLRLKRTPAAALLTYPAALTIWCQELTRRSARQRFPGAGGTVRRLDGFDGRFDDFWAALRAVPNRLLPVRSRTALLWHYRLAQNHGRVAILALESGGAMSGYAVLLRRNRDDVGLSRYGVADLQVLRQEPQLVAALLRAALDLAREEGAHVLEVMGFGAFTRGVLAQLGPRWRRFPVHPYQYKVLNPALVTELANPDVWDPTPYDGDAAI